MSKFTIKSAAMDLTPLQVGSTIYGDEVVRLDAAAKLGGVTRSSLIRQMILHCLDQIDLTEAAPVAANHTGRLAEDDAA